jgi:hypothetical protein
MIGEAIAVRDAEPPSAHEERVRHMAAQEDNRLRESDHHPPSQA